MPIQYRLDIQVIAVENNNHISEKTERIVIDPIDLDVRTKEGLASVIRAEAGNAAVKAFDKVWKALKD